MKIIGKTTIHPILFYTGKFAGYCVWVVYWLSILNVIDLNGQSNEILCISALGISILSILIIIVSLFNLGDSTSLGVPSEKTTLKSEGLYRFSRNPMYLGFNLMTISSVFYLNSYIILVLGVYSVVVYHFIILGEEKFLKKRFGKEFESYMDKVRRYI